MKSQIAQGARVPFAAFTGQLVYMREFTKAAGLPADLLRWQDTVDAMLEGVDACGSIFLMVDQAPVKAHAVHRRPGVHIDGYWDPIIRAHGGESPGHRHRSPPPRPQRSGEMHILASDHLGCAAYVGALEQSPGVGGDCSHFDLAKLDRVEMEPAWAWSGNAMSMLHESIPVSRDCLRTVVRLNVPGCAGSAA